MLNKFLFYQFPGVKSAMTRWIYDLVSALDRDRKVILMNYGFIHDDADSVSLPLDAIDEPHRYPLQLYHYVASAVDWNGRDVLEVSSGRGGGAYFLARHFKPKSYIGMDFSKRAVAFCNMYYQWEGLSFHHGNAEAIPFSDSSFDIVINVEASLYYPNVARFFENVRRVLKPNGYFLYADLRYPEKADAWRAQLKDIGLKMLKEEEITDNVLKAMEIDRDRRWNIVQKYTPRALHKVFYDFCGLDADAPLRVAPHLNDRRYWNFVFQKTQ